MWSHQVFFFFFRFIYLWLHWVFNAALGFSLLVAIRASLVSMCGLLLFRCVGFLLPRFILFWRTSSMALRLSSWGSQALELRLSSCGALALTSLGMWDLPRPGTQPVSPTRVLCIGRQILYHWATREVLLGVFKSQFQFQCCFPKTIMLKPQPPCENMERRQPST